MSKARLETAASFDLPSPFEDLKEVNTVYEKKFDFQSVDELAPEEDSLIKAILEYEEQLIKLKEENDVLRDFDKSCSDEIASITDKARKLQTQLESAYNEYVNLKKCVTIFSSNLPKDNSIWIEFDRKETGIFLLGTEMRKIVARKISRPGQAYLCCVCNIKYHNKQSYVDHFNTNTVQCKSTLDLPDDVVVDVIWF